jgi:hypothetical protein
MNDFVSDEISQDEVGCEDKPPVEGQVSAGRTVSELGALPHQVDPLREHSKARAHYGQVAFDLLTRLPS